MNPAIISKDFASLRECIEYLTQHFPPSSLTLPSNSIDGDAKEMQPAPKFLFRGESGLFPNTVSSMQRLKALQCLPTSARDELERISISLDGALQAFWNIGPLWSSGFCQHYGMPTELIDITASLDVAAFFASTGEAGSKGAMAFFPPLFSHRKQS